MLHLKHGTVEYVGPMAHAPKAAPAPSGAASCGESGSLFQQVRGWLLTERAEKAERAMHMEVESTPATPAPTAAPVASKPVSASPFDRFGGGSRHSMYR